MRVPLRVIQGGATGGPNDPSLEQRLTTLENSVTRVEAKLDRVELRLAELLGAVSQMPKQADQTSIKTELARIDGKVSNLPSTWTLITFAIGSCLASAGFAFTIARLIKQ